MVTMRIDRLALAVLGVLAMLLSGVSAAYSATLTIYEHSGGDVIHAARKAGALDRSGGTIRFDGPCRSACTLYLSVDNDRLCITRRASFSFHRPRGKTRTISEAGAIYMMGKYPAWVRAWIEEKGGLVGSFKTMRFEYASKYLRTC